MFILASPRIIIPPQSPAFLSIVSLLEVKTIGLILVPLAISLDPLVMISVPQDSSSPRIIVPGSIVSVALLVKYTFILNTYVLFFVCVLLFSLF